MIFLCIFPILITKIHGRDRVTGVTVAKVNEKMQPIAGTEFDIECDTLLLSVGLIPENELSRSLDLEMHPLTSGPIVDQRRRTSLPGFMLPAMLYMYTTW